MCMASLYFPCWVQSFSLVTPVRFCTTEIWFPWIYILFFKMFFLWNYILYTVKCTCQPPVISICLLYIYKLLIHYLFCILTGTWKEWFIVSIIWFLFWDFLAFHFSSFYDGCLVVLLSSISWTCLVKWSSITTTLVVDRLYIPRFHG